MNPSLPNLYYLMTKARYDHKNPEFYVPIQLNFQILKVNPATDYDTSYVSYDKWEPEPKPWVLFTVNGKYFIYETFQDSWDWNNDGRCEEDIREITKEEAHSLL